jgi:hypothetical protein
MTKTFICVLLILTLVQCTVDRKSFQNEVEGNVLQETVSYLLLHYGTNTHSSKLHEFNIIIIYLVTARATLIE